tara:strand:+ start:282 stop:503 length:222 start_codon:yes stop_codon:yes gene_type:complete
MEDIFTLLLYTGGFYFLMCFGCGAHMAHGHHKNKVTPTPTIDSVFDLELEYYQGYGKLQDGHLFRFYSNLPFK